MGPGAAHQVEELPKDLYDESFAMFNSLVSPWRQWLDPVAYNRHVDTVEALGHGWSPRRTAPSCGEATSTTPSTGSVPWPANHG